MDKLERYIERFSSAGTETEIALLDELERVTNLRAVQPKMVSGKVQGAFLRLITEILQPRLVLEIGTFTGYSALAMAAGLKKGGGATGQSGAGNKSEPFMADFPMLHTVEIDDELEELARSFFDRSSHGGKIRLHIGSALDVVPKLSRRLGRPFDMVYIDGDKREYPDYYRMLMGDEAGSRKAAGSRSGADGEAAGGTAGSTDSSTGMVCSGSIILADNVLWYGKVVEENNGKMDRHTEGIVEFNRLVSSDPRVENVILPLRDGINLIRVK